MNRPDLTGAVTYPGTPPAQREAANLRKREFMAVFDAYHGQYAMNNRSKPFLGELSPGCRTCMQGTWSCVYLNGLCTRNCFYCPQDRKITEEPPARTDDELTFTSARDYVDYTRHFACEGIGISGGEPFLAFNKLVEHIRMIREAFGSRPHVWSYTNGDLATDERLALLKKAGLDELRFNISANAYDLSAVSRATRHIDTITVEIPAIPEDVALVKSLLPEMEAAGVKHLNLHQLLMNEHNHLQLKMRGYTVTQADRYLHGRPILDSELAAFDILEHALRTKSGLGINYCSRCYKARFQEKAFRKRHAFLFGIPGSSLTAAGYLRTVSLEVPEDGFARLQAHFRKTGRTEQCRVTQVDAGFRIEVPADYLDGLLDLGLDLAIVITYADPILQPLDPTTADVSGSKTFADNRVVLNPEMIREFRLDNPAAVVFFIKLFVEGKNPAQAVREVADFFGVAEDGIPSIRKDLEEFFCQFDAIEHTSTDLPDYD
jgi:pyruvate formate-lyase activating enzyme-like uncharacterized protein